MENELLGGFGPHGVFGVRCVRGKVSKGLAVVQPRLFDLLGGVGVIRDSEIIRLGDACVTLFTEFLPWLGVEEFLQLCLELLLWGFLVAFGNFDRFPSVVVSVPLWPGIPRTYNISH
jgi:hypothetical protein